MRNAIAIVALAGLSTVASANIIAQWNFNGTSTTTVPGGISSPTASVDNAVGTPAASLVGGTVGSFASGTANGGSSDPVTTTPANYGWGTTTYPAASASNEGAGVQFLVSTVGYSNIVLTFDIRHSNTSSRFERVQYTLDGGTTWINSTLFDGNAGDTWFRNRTVDLSAITGANENANFGIRVVSSFGTGAAYAASGSTSTYAATGTWRFDMVTLVPAPGAAAMLGLGALVAGRRKR